MLRTGTPVSLSSSALLSRSSSRNAVRWIWSSWAWLWLWAPISIPARASSRTWAQLSIRSSGRPAALSPASASQPVVRKTVAVKPRASRRGMTVSWKSAYPSSKVRTTDLSGKGRPVSTAAANSPKVDVVQPCARRRSSCRANASGWTDSRRVLEGGVSVTEWYISTGTGAVMQPPSGRCRDSGRRAPGAQPPDAVSPDRGPQAGDDRGGASRPLTPAVQSLAQAPQHPSPQHHPGVLTFRREPVLDTHAASDQRLGQALGVAAGEKVGEPLPRNGRSMPDDRPRLVQEDHAGQSLADPDAELRLLTAERT